MSKPIIRYVSLRGGRCQLTTDSKRNILSREGWANVREIRNATERDVRWVRTMGGEVPDGRIEKAKT